jgi:uncharacterized protein YciI
MLNLYIKGSMKLAGPLTDDAGGAVLLAVADESEAKTIVAADPAVKSRTKGSTQPVAPAEHQSGAR